MWSWKNCFDPSSLIGINWVSSYQHCQVLFDYQPFWPQIVGKCSWSRLLKQFSQTQLRLKYLAERLDILERQKYDDWRKAGKIILLGIIPYSYKHNLDKTSMQETPLTWPPWTPGLPAGPVWPCRPFISMERIISNLFESMTISNLLVQSLQLIPRIRC